MMVSAQLHAPVVLPPAQCPVTRWIRVWMGPRADLSLLEERKTLVGAAIRTPDVQNMEHLRHVWRRSRYVTSSRFIKCGKVLTSPRPFATRLWQHYPQTGSHSNRTDLIHIYRKGKTSFPPHRRGSSWQFPSLNRP